MSSTPAEVHYIVGRRHFVLHTANGAVGVITDGDESTPMTLVINRDLTDFEAPALSARLTADEARQLGTELLAVADAMDDTP